jgi:hypothetical protein
MGEDHSCAPHRDAFAIPHDIDRLGWNAIELRERALDGSSVDVGLISFSEFSGCVTTMIRDRCQTLPAVYQFLRPRPFSATPLASMFAN